MIETRRRYKILFIIPSLYCGGVEKVLVVLLRHLDRTRFDPLVALFSQVNDFTGEMPDDVPILKLNGQASFGIMGKLLSLYRVVKHEKPDIMVTFVYRTVILFPLMVAVLRLAAMQTPVVFTEHSNLTAVIKHGRLRWLRRMLAKHTGLYPKEQYTVCVSEGIRKDLVNQWGVVYENTAVIHNPIEIARIQVQAQQEIIGKRENDILTIAACGRLVPVKNYPLLLRAFALITEVRNDVRLVIIGDGVVMDHLKKYAIKLRIDEKLDFLGQQKNPFPFIAQAKVLALTSKIEGFGNVLVEAMACGTPVVSTRCPSGPEEIISSGINGVLVNVDDEQQLAKELLHILEDEQYRNRLAKAGRERAKSFDAQKITTEYEKLFLHILGE